MYTPTLSLATLAAILLSLSSPATALPTTSLVDSSALAARGLWDFVFPPSLTGNPSVYGAPPNNFAACGKSTKNPVVLLHGLSANREVDLNMLQQHLNGLGWCTFSITYGAHALAPSIGGLRPMRDSAKEIAAFIKEVHTKTGGKKKIDIVGHSEGGVHSIYVPLTQPGIASITGRVVALGPAIHGAKYFGFTDLWYFGGDITRAFVGKVLKGLGCPACDDMATDGNVYKDFKAKAGKIAQPGVKTTVVMSTADKLVAPATSKINEPGVRNVLVQDHCKDDKVGHAGLMWDRNVWEIVKLELEEKYTQKVAKCDTKYVLTI